MDSRQALRFGADLISWYRVAGRELPWRGVRDPYLIWVSEVILQQTQVAQALGYYARFVRHFPTVQTLAAASMEELLLVWQGLGYYSRAHNMQVAARTIVQEHGGVFPREAAAVAALRGVGPYTTAAIMSFAYDAPHAVLDGNVFRVLSRYTADATAIDTTAGRRHFQTLAEALLCRSEPAVYNQAIMDLGALVCTPQQAHCEVCPVAAHCASAGRRELWSQLPVKQGRTRVQECFLDYVCLIVGEGVVVEQRDKSGIWKGLFQFPLLGSGEAYLDHEEWCERLGRYLRAVGVAAPKARRMVSEGSGGVVDCYEVTHRLSHRLLHVRVQTLLLRVSEPESLAWQICPIGSHDRLAFPRPLRAFLDKHFRPTL